MSVIDPPAPVGETAAVDRFVADVLHRAHRTAEAVHRPDEARVILDIAQLFAEELARKKPRFDRIEFIHSITREPA